MNAVAAGAFQPLPDTVDVLIVGAGPIGLSVAFQLALAGVDALVVERRETPSLHPKANGVFSRTLEAFRQWGIADETALRSLPREECLGFVWMTRMAGYELGNVMFADSVDELWEEYAKHSPETPLFIPQDKIERLLAEKIEAQDTVQVRFGWRAANLNQHADHVDVTLQAADGTQHCVRARYVVGADGARSAVRKLVGIEENGSGETWGESLNIYFESEEFTALRAGRPYQLWWTLNEDVRGAFYPVAHKDRWIFTPEGEEGKGADYYTVERCVDMVRKGAGANIALKVISVAPWRHEVAIAKEWRRDRVFLAGDAAHRFPPHGGYGMNSGIQDAQNLGWKLIAVLQGRAGDKLLDSYAAERQPVAEANAEQTLRNFEALKETGWFMPNPAELALIETDAGKPIRDRIAAAVPNQRASVFSHGLQFGAIYHSEAIVSDGTIPPVSTLVDYHESASPGARAPHLTVTRDDGRTCSILDLFRLDGLVLLAGDKGEPWAAAAAALDVTAYVISSGGGRYRSDRFLEVYGLAADGAVLVRPDGYVAWRSANLTADPEKSLRRAYEAVMAQPAAYSLSGGAPL